VPDNKNPWRFGCLKIVFLGQRHDMSLIGVEGLQFYSHHGYYKEEQVLGGKYVVDFYLNIDLSEAAASDQLTKTINYEQVYQIAKTENGSSF
jgi:dihydroneopterin aldolase